VGGSLLGANFPRECAVLSQLCDQARALLRATKGIKLSQSGRKLVCDKEVTIEAKEELPLRA
jgi:hypothetical protein